MVSISQSYLCPIVRGESKASVEFGEKYDVGIDEKRYARLEKIAFDLCNDSTIFIDAMEHYKERTGHYPKRVLVDQMYNWRVYIMAEVWVHLKRYTIEELAKHNIIVTDTGENNQIILHDFPKIIEGRGRLEITICGNCNVIEMFENITVSGVVIIRIIPAMNGMANDCNVTIKKGVYFNGMLQMNINEKGNCVSIGENCLFAANVVMCTSDSHSIYDLSTNEKLNYGGNITIGNHVWVAQYCYFLKNVIISDDSVVGMHSVVTKKFVEPNQLIVGIPARVVRKGINWDKSNKWPL